jgi:hypothetical protein
MNSNFGQFALGSVLDCGVNDQFAACEIADAGINLAHHLSLKRAIITDEPVAEFGDVQPNAQTVKAFLRGLRGRS